MAYPAKTWAKVKADYETGNFSANQVAEKWSISVQAVKKRIRAEKWQKGKSIPKIEEKIRDASIESYAKLGMPLKKALKICIRLMESDDPVIAEKGLTHFEKQTGINAPEKLNVKNTGMTLEEAMEILKEKGIECEVE